MISVDMIEEILNPSAPRLEEGLGIIETGFISGGLCALCGVAFELLGLASRDLASDSAAVSVALASRLCGEVASDLLEMIPAVANMDEDFLLSLSGRLKGFSPKDIYAGIAVEDAVALARERLIPFIVAAMEHYLSRCSQVSDRAFSRCLNQSLARMQEVSTVLNLEPLSDALSRSELRKLEVEVLDSLGI